MGSVTLVGPVVVNVSALAPEVVKAPAREIVMPATLPTVGLGYVPPRSPPAAPEGAAPVIVTLDAALIRPSAPTVKGCSPRGTSA